MRFPKSVADIQESFKKQKIKLIDFGYYDRKKTYEVYLIAKPTISFAQLLSIVYTANTVKLTILGSVDEGLFIRILNIPKKIV